jgi:hypothetical protein
MPVRCGHPPYRHPSSKLLAFYISYRNVAITLRGAPGVDAVLACRLGHALELQVAFENFFGMLADQQLVQMLEVR